MTVTVIIEVWCERKELIGYEQEAIDRARHNGEKLYNASLIAGRPGGVGHPHSTATRKKLSAIAKAQNRHIPQTDEVKAKIKHTKRAKLKPKQLTLGVGGRPAVTAETRAKQSASLLRYNAENARSLETRQKLSVSKMGHEVSEEARRKISEAQKRRLSDPVKRAKCGVWAGKKQSSEHKAKIAAGMRSFKAAQREAAI